MGASLLKASIFVLTLLSIAALSLGRVVRSSTPPTVDLLTAASPLGNWESEERSDRLLGWLDSSSLLLGRTSPTDADQEGFYQWDITFSKKRLLVPLSQKLGRTYEGEKVSPDGSRLLLLNRYQGRWEVADTRTLHVEPISKVSDQCFFLPDSKAVATWNYASRRLCLWRDQGRQQPTAIKKAASNHYVLGADADGLLILEPQASFWFESVFHLNRLPFQSGRSRERRGREAIPLPHDCNYARLSSVVLSPDGQWMTLVRLQFHSSQLPEWMPPLFQKLRLNSRPRELSVELWVCRVDGSDIRKVGEMRFEFEEGRYTYDLEKVLFSPDNRHIAFQISVRQLSAFKPARRMVRKYLLPIAL